MRESRNPFRLRRSESIDTDTTFLTLFEPGILEVLSPKGLPQTVQPLRSAAGGGKTSLLRLFTPSVLNKLHDRRGDAAVKELHARLVALGALDSNGPCLLGVPLLCGRNYSVLQDMKIDDATRTRLFFGLLNARILLSVLRSALALRSLNHPDDLSRISVVPRTAADGLGGIAFPCTGQTLYDWARGIERTICMELDSFGPLRATSLPGHDALFALDLVHPDSVRLDGEPVAKRVILMMDDVHMLTPQQRSLLIERVIEARGEVGVWIAERFEALSTPEILASGSSVGRDHEKSVEVEWYWRAHYERFEKHVMRAAARRVKASTQTERDEFGSCLEENLDGAAYESRFERALQEVSARVRRRVASQERFRTWVLARERESGTPRDRAVAWRALEILIERELRRPQKGLFDESTVLNEGALDGKDDSRVTQAAELFLAKEYDLPYYYGSERVARLASLNIEQFLGLAGAIFEEVIAAELIHGGVQVLPAERQHSLMKAAASSYWDDIPKRVRNGKELQKLLHSIGTFSNWFTYRPTAPNDPGVGGTAIRMSERKLLLDSESLAKRPGRARFAELISLAIAHNYLVVDLDYKCKNDLWMVLNLNRLLCVHFDLLLGYGLYKERPLDELCSWVDKPFSAPRREESNS